MLGRLQGLRGLGDVDSKKAAIFANWLSADQWRDLFAANAGSYNLDAQIDFLVAWIALESGGNPCSFTHCCEVGIFQLMPPDNTNTAGTTMQALRPDGLCTGASVSTMRPGGCTGSAGCFNSNAGPIRQMTDDEKMIQVTSGLQYVSSLRDLVTSRLAGTNITWTENDWSFWAMVKLYFNLPGVFTQMIANAAGLDQPPADFSELRAAGNFPSNYDDVLDNAEAVGSYGGGTSGEAGHILSNVPKFVWVLLAGVGLTAATWFGVRWWTKHKVGHGVAGPGEPTMLKMIASESRTPEEFAKRAEAWASTEARPPSIAMIAKAYKKVPANKITRLYHRARSSRLAAARSRWQRIIAEPSDDEDEERDRKALAAPPLCDDAKFRKKHPKACEERSDMLGAASRWTHGSVARSLDVPESVVRQIYAAVKTAKRQRLHGGYMADLIERNVGRKLVGGEYTVAARARKHLNYDPPGGYGGPKPKASASEPSRDYDEYRAKRAQEIAERANATINDVLKRRAKWSSEGWDEPKDRDRLRMAADELDVAADSYEEAGPRFNVRAGTLRERARQARHGAYELLAAYD